MCVCCCVCLCVLYVCVLVCMFVCVRDRDVCEDMFMKYLCIQRLSPYLKLKLVTDIYVSLFNDNIPCLFFVTLFDSSSKWIVFLFTKRLYSVVSFDRMQLESLSLMYMFLHFIKRLQLFYSILPPYWNSYWYAPCRSFDCMIISHGFLPSYSTSYWPPPYIAVY